jgi:hypothetical protein
MLAVEASPAHFAVAREQLADVPVRLVNAALVGPDCDASTVRLYRTARGTADSLFGKGEHDDVKAVRLSTLIPSDRVALVRMNVEGSELDIVEDLLDAGVPVAGWYGMWDDAERKGRAERLRQLMREYGIRTITFNERDTRWRIRLWAIRHDIQGRVRRPGAGAS